MTQLLPGRWTIEVELYGIPRQRAGMARITVPLDQPEVSLQALLHQLEQTHPELAASCFPHGQLEASCTANVDARQFVRDPGTVLRSGQQLLIMSADVGG